jgi:hypothetical protein
MVREQTPQKITMNDEQKDERNDKCAERKRRNVININVCLPVLKYKIDGKATDSNERARIGGMTWLVRHLWPP